MGEIQFIANYDEWIAVKKLKIDEKVDPRTIIEFIASLGFSFDRKIEENLRKTVQLERLEKAISEELSEIGKGSKGISEALAKINSVKISRIIKEISKKPELQKKEIKELEEFCRVFALRKALAAAGLKVNYSEIETPSIKAALKKAKKLAK